MLDVFDNSLPGGGNNDQAYLKHLAQHPTHYVLNAHRQPKTWYLVLHRATCHSISRIAGRGKADGFTERTFLKVVSEQEAEIKTWLKGQGLPGEFSSICGICFKQNSCSQRFRGTYTCATLLVGSPYFVDAINRVCVGSNSMRWSR